MEANRTSPAKTAWIQAFHTVKKTLQVGSASTTRFARSTSTKIFVWCRDHILSVALLLVFPIGIAGYYWGGSTFDQNPAPIYLASDPEEKPVHPVLEPAQNEERPLVSVIPETPLTAETPQLLNVPDHAEGAELIASHPLPIAVENPEIFPTANQEPYPAWNLGFAAESQPAASSMNCVWLTGTIEELDGSADFLQNASRIHELTHPNRN